MPDNPHLTSPDNLYFRDLKSTWSWSAKNPSQTCCHSPVLVFGCTDTSSPFPPDSMCFLYAVILCYLKHSGARTASCAWLVPLSDRSSSVCALLPLCSVVGALAQLVSLPLQLHSRA